MKKSLIFFFFNHALFAFIGVHLVTYYSKLIISMRMLSFHYKHFDDNVS